MLRAISLRESWMREIRTSGLTRERAPNGPSLLYKIPMHGDSSSDDAAPRRPRRPTKKCRRNRDLKVYGFAISEYPIEPLYPAAAAQEPYEYAKITLKQIRDYLDGKDVPKQVLRRLKIITHGKPAPGEVG